MKISKLSDNNYYLNSSILFFKSFFDKRIEFLNKKKFLFSEISNFINNCIDNSKSVFMFCAANSIISKNIKSDKIYIKEISERYKIKYNEKLNYVDKIDEEKINKCDTIIVSDIEHQINPASNLLELSKLIDDDAKIIVISKNMFWLILTKILKFFFKFSPVKNNFLPSSYLQNLYSSCNLEVIRNEKIIALPIYIPFFTNFINRIFRLPILNLFCVNNLTILKKIKKNADTISNLKVSFVIPCKNEKDNIGFFEKEINLANPNYEYLFGDDISNDGTSEEIDKLIKKLFKNKILKYQGPGICKSENVYKGIDNASGDIIVIYDADLTVSFKDIEFALEILRKTNADFINCTRMIYPQRDGAMKLFNFIGNSFFAGLFSILFKKKSRIRCVELKFFTKRTGKI